jgi:hypothetical protein
MVIDNYESDKNVDYSLEDNPEGSKEETLLEKMKRLEEDALKPTKINNSKVNQYKGKKTNSPINKLLI